MAPPPWIDDLFPFPTPAPLAALVDIAWATHEAFGFDLTSVPRPPPHLPMFAVPEFVPFGALGGGGYVGWAVPAPELGGLDHPACHADGHQSGVILLGENTRAGLEFLRHRDWPDRYSDEATTLTFDVPAGWRYVAGEDVIGVLAPAGAFAPREPVVARVELDEPLEPALTDAAAHLDAGYPATALLGIKDTFVNTPLCYFTELKSLWAMAYRELGRPELIAGVDAMADMYESLPCFCATSHA